MSIAYAFMFLPCPIAPYSLGTLEKRHFFNLSRRVCDVSSQIAHLLTHLLSLIVLSRAVKTGRDCGGRERPMILRLNGYSAQLGWSLRRRRGSWGRWDIKENVRLRNALFGGLGNSDSTSVDTSGFLGAEKRCGRNRRKVEEENNSTVTGALTRNSTSPRNSGRWQQ